jgi:sugar phosphate isomerase/epimerase
MLQGLTKAGLGAIENNAQLIDLASRYKFQSVDTDAVGLIEELGGTAQANEFLRQKGVSIGSIHLSVDWRTTVGSFNAGLGKLVEEAQAAAFLGCTSCCTYILPSVDASPAHFMALATKRLQTCARILAAYGIRLGLEFVGPHHLRTRWAHPFIWTMQETLDWIDAIREPNVGLLLDSYHWYTTGMAVADIERLKAEQIVHVHINDAKNVPVEEVLDNDRLYPGEGVIDLAGFLRGLHTIGYRGTVAQEILSKSPPSDAREVLAARSREGFDKVFRAAGIMQGESEDR